MLDVMSVVLMIQMLHGDVRITSWLASRSLIETSAFKGKNFSFMCNRRGDALEVKISSNHEACR